MTEHIEGAAQRLGLVNRQIREADKRLDRLTEKLAGDEETAEGQTHEQRDVTILRSLPGVGRIVLATLLTEAQHALQRRDYHALRCLSGVAPITKRSGKSTIVLMRQTAHVRLRNAVYHWARTAVQHDPRSRAKYAALRARRHGHGQALRSVADRLLAVACAMLQTRAPFDPSLPAKIPIPARDRALRTVGSPPRPSVSFDLLLSDIICRSIPSRTKSPCNPRRAGVFSIRTSTIPSIRSELWRQIGKVPTLQTPASHLVILPDRDVCRDSPTP